MTDKLLKQIITEAVQTAIIGRKVVQVEVHLPNRFVVTFDNGLKLATIFENIVEPPNEMKDDK